MTLSRPQRELLKQLVFRWPHPCFVVISGRGLYALVVTAMMRSRCLERLPRAYQRRTTVELREAGLITLEERFMAIPPYGFRDSADTDHGWLVAVTAAGRAAINAVTEEQQRRAQAMSAAEMAARGAAARARGARIQRGEVPGDARPVPMVCPDGGACHHECAPVSCFRVGSCGPLSGVYPGDRWPASVVVRGDDREA